MNCFVYADITVAHGQFSAGFAGAAVDREFEKHGVGHFLYYAQQT
jgi:hypothetical protein